MGSVRSFSKPKGAVQLSAIPFANSDGIVILLIRFGVNLDTKVMFLFSQYQLHQNNIQLQIIHFYD